MTINREDAFAEVFESSVTGFTAQCWEWDDIPEIGSCVMVVENDCDFIIGCITNIKTSSMYSDRQPFAFQKTEEELRIEQPQIFELLKTEFQVHFLGFCHSKSNCKNAFYCLPKRPPKMHSFVYKLSEEIGTFFFKSTEFLQIFFSFSKSIECFDDILISFLYCLFQTKIVEQSFLPAFCSTFSLLTKNDYYRLRLFLKRFQLLRVWL